VSLSAASSLFCVRGWLAVAKASAAIPMAASHWMCVSTPPVDPQGTDALAGCNGFIQRSLWNGRTDIDTVMFYGPGPALAQPALAVVGRHPQHRRHSRRWVASGEGSILWSASGCRWGLTTGILRRCVWFESSQRDLRHLRATILRLQTSDRRGESVCRS